MNFSCQLKRFWKPNAPLFTRKNKQSGENLSLKKVSACFLVDKPSSVGDAEPRGKVQISFEESLAKATKQAKAEQEAKKKKLTTLHNFFASSPPASSKSAVVVKKTVEVDDFFSAKKVRFNSCPCIMNFLSQMLESNISLSGLFCSNNSCIQLQEGPLFIVAFLLCLLAVTVLFFAHRDKFVPKLLCFYHHAFLHSPIV